MIAERYPELASLEPNEQLTLASELASTAARRGAVPELTPKSLEILDQRIDHFLAHPETGISWEDLQKQHGIK